MHARRSFAILTTAAALLGASSAMCSRPGAPPPDAASLTKHTATGVVRALDAEKKTILVAHQEIAGYMKAMTMQFDLRDRELVQGISVGDKIEFTFTDDGRGNLVVQSLRKVP